MKKILIVDDDADLREVFKTVLSKKYQLAEAATAKEGLAKAESFRPDLVLLDVMMESDMAGFDMARELKNTRGMKSVKILMVTNIDNEKHLDFASAAGDQEWLPVDDFVSKPVDPKTLLSKVEKLV